MKNTDLRLDAYIAKSAPFARPILTKLRAAVHEAAQLNASIAPSRPKLRKAGPETGHSRTARRKL